jgi:hypothetical protein
MARRRAIAIAGPSRLSTGYISRLLIAFGILVAVCAIVLAAAGGFFTYRILTDYNPTENVNPTSFLLSNYEDLSFTDPDGLEHEGWLLHGLKGAPVIILSHGYDSNRSELLSLATVLQESHFNVYLFNYHPVHVNHRVTDLGVRQVGILEAALAKVTALPGVNPNRVGLFGKGPGGYASLVVAERNPLVKTIVVDNAYEKPLDLFNSQISQILGSTPLFRVVMDAEFRLLNIRTKEPQLSENLSKLNSIPKLFISGRDVPPLAAIMEGFYDRAGQPKRLLVMGHTQVAFVTGTEKKEYESQILGFFSEQLTLHTN